VSNGVTESESEPSGSDFDGRLAGDLAYLAKLASSGEFTARPLDPVDGYEELVPGLEICSEVVLRIPDYEGVAVVAYLRLTDGRMCVSTVALSTAKPGGVTGEIVRGLQFSHLNRLGFLTRQSAEDWGWEDRRLDVGYGLLTLSERDALRANGPTKETVRWAALLYRAALAAGDPPTKFVAETFMVSSRTAGLWIARARTLGYLPPAEGTGKAYV
jgi:hypothetical protein